jgi:hypothetical protein
MDSWGWVDRERIMSLALYRIFTTQAGELEADDCGPFSSASNSQAPPERVGRRGRFGSNGQIAGDHPS